MQRFKKKIKGAFPLIRRDLRNRWHYYRYNVKYSFCARPLFYLLTAVSFILGFVVFVNEILTRWTNPALGGIAIIQWVVAVIMLLCQWEENKEKKELYIEQISEIYDAVIPPKEGGWQQCTIRVRHADQKVVEEATIFINQCIDEWLQDGDNQIIMNRKRSYERMLKQKITKHYIPLYRHFLRYNYRESLFFGRQFQNEKKMGISEEFKFGDTEIQVHKSCYFDTYLTNIIPGKQLRSTRYGNKLFSVEDKQFLPYYVSEDETKWLSPIGNPVTSNELGVTTLCFLYHDDYTNDYIPLWTQNHQAQSSRGQFVATGSGSADWDDCVYAMKYCNGSFTDAIVRGMERELYEEAIGNRDLSWKEFQKKTQTKIIGYFRWLGKGGKSEFVGISKAELENFFEIITPEKSEVIEGVHIQSTTIFELKKQLEKLVYPEENEANIIISEGCSISCAATILALQSLCEKKICSCCEKHGRCENNDCKKKPVKILFDNKKSV